MTKKVALVGHCGPDSSGLRIAIDRAFKNASILAADDDTELRQVLEQSPDLLLFNRELGYGFSDPAGVNLIATLHKQMPQLKLMLVSNYPDVQVAAVAAGAVPGFGKREMGSARVTEVLRDALKEPARATE